MATTPTADTIPMRMSPSQHGRIVLKGYSSTTCPIFFRALHPGAPHTDGVADRAKL